MSYTAKVSFKYILIIVLIGLILRIAFCLLVPVPVTKDSYGYNKLALSLASGNGLAYDMKNPTLFRGPVYPLFLSGIYSIFGYNFTIARIAQSLLGAAMCLVFFYLSRQYLDKTLSKQVLIALALHPVLIALSSSLLSELLFTFLLGLSAIALTYGFGKKNNLAYFISGLLFGVTTLTRSITAYFAPFLLCAQLIFYKNKKLILSHITLFLCGQLLLILPWTLRNYAVSGQFCPVATGGGIALWLGTYTPGRGYDLGMNPEVYRKYEEVVGKGQSYTSIENDKKLFRASVENIKNDPAGYILLIPVKLQRMFITSYSSFFNLHKIPLTDYLKNTRLILQMPFIPLWKGLMLFISVAIAAFGFLGVWQIRHNVEKFMPVLIIVAYFIIFHALSFASARSGIPVLPFLLIFAVVGFNSMFSVKSRI